MGDSSLKEFILSNQDYFENFITRSTYHSNRIEGSTISYADTYAIIFNDNSFKVSASPREIYDAINHKYAIDYIISHLDENLSERFIKDIGIIINKNINEVDGYRKGQVYVRGAEHIPPSPQMVSSSMMYFVYNYNNTVYDSIFDKIADNHIQFERIHPFSDGNGRTGRLLLNYELIKNNIAPVVIPSDNKGEYFELLANQDAKGLSVFLDKLSQIEADTIKKFSNDNSGEIQDEPWYIDR